MTENQIKALEMYLDVIKSLNNMSDRFASIGIIIEQEVGINNSVQDHYNSVIVALDDYIKEILNLNNYSEKEMFFETVSNFINERETKDSIINKLKLLLNR